MEETYLFYDWGDTVIFHPFFSVNRMIDYLSPPEGIESWDGHFEHHLELICPWGRTIRYSPGRMLKSVLRVMAGRRENS